MAARCPDCDRPLVPVEVPPTLREFAPDGASHVGLCPRCLRTVPLDDSGAAPGSADTAAAVDADADADRPDSIPEGDGGVAIVLLLGLLDSLATNRTEIEALVDHAERGGADVFLALDRLAADESVDARVDLGRRRRQLESLLDY